MQHSTSEMDLNRFDSKDAEADKKKRGRSPFRLVCILWHKNNLLMSAKFNFATKSEQIV